MKKNDNNMIYIWRIIFTYMVAVLHFDDVYQVCRGLMGKKFGWYIAVEFFFIVSGYLLYQSAVFRKEKYPSTVAYIKSRYTQIYPVYLWSFILTFLFWSEGNFRVRISMLLESFWELICLQCVLFNGEYLNVNLTAWYISALLICSFFMFFLLRYHEKLTVDFLIPLGVIIIYSCLYREIGHLAVLYDVENFYLNGAIMRGIAAMGLGVVAARINCYLQEHAKNMLWWKALGILGFAFVLYGSTTHRKTNLDFVMVIILTFSIAVAFLPNERWNVPQIIKKWSGACLGIYLIHEIFRTYVFPGIWGVPESISERLMLELLYCVVITVAGILLKLVSDCTRKLILKFKSYLLIN